MTTRKNIIVVKSEIAGKMAPTDWGEFPSVAAAEQFGSKNIKYTQWAVANESVLRDGNEGEVKISYTLLTDIINPRYTDE